MKEKNYIVTLVYPVILKTLRKFVDEAYESGQLKSSPKAPQLKQKKSDAQNILLGVLKQSRSMIMSSERLKDLKKSDQTTVVAKREHSPKPAPKIS